VPPARSLSQASILTQNHEGHRRSIHAATVAIGVVNDVDYSAIVLLNNMYPMVIRAGLVCAAANPTRITIPVDKVPTHLLDPLWNAVAVWEPMMPLKAEGVEYIKRLRACVPH
jgi:hypothetical protein